MKPAIQCNEVSRRDFCDRDFHEGSALPKTDFSFQAGSNGGGRCFGSRQPSFRSISQDYFKYEAPPTFVREVALFAVIVMTAAVPIMASVGAIFHLVRSFGIL